MKWGYSLLKYWTVGVAIPFYVYLRLKKLELRFVPMPNRIGHLVGGTELLLSQRDAGEIPETIKYISYFPPSYQNPNRFIVKMMKKSPEFNVSHINYALSLVHRLCGHTITVGEYGWYERDNTGVLLKTKPHFWLKDHHIKKGEHLLEKLGISPDDKIVGVATRGKSYLEWFYGKNPAYHDCRNCDIADYKLAITHLIHTNRTVIRMGTHIDNILEMQDPRYIELDHLGLRTEMLDVYISQRCEFFISCGTGIDALASRGYRKPMLYVNFSNICGLSVWENRCLQIFKPFWSQEKGRYLTLHEIRKMGACHFTSVHNTQYGIERHDNTPQEILDATQEFEQRLAGQWVTTSADQAMQKRFWEIFMTPYPSNAPSCDVGKRECFKARIGTQFLRDHSYLLD
ncbi:MAG: TIGR04372 family glycosyltransferase [bacterium]|nr:TIGR04372 family glycosyltransferase [bacterium]